MSKRAAKLSKLSSLLIITIISIVNIVSINIDDDHAVNILSRFFQNHELGDWELMIDGLINVSSVPPP